MKTNSAQMRRSLRRFLVVGAAAAATVLGASTIASAAADGTSVLADAQCSASGGVVDVTLVNDGSEPALFEVAGATYEVAPLDAHALTFEGVGNGTFTLGVTANGADESVSVDVSCQTPVVAALAVDLPRVPSGSLPTTGGEVGWGLAIGGALVVAGVTVSLLARRRHYS